MPTQSNLGAASLHSAAAHQHQTPLLPAGEGSLSDAEGQAGVLIPLL